MTQSEIILDIQNVAASYGRAQVLRDVTLQVKTGECFGLIGLNGAGKTTLIKAALALRDYDSGSISIFGADREARDVKLRLAFLPERFDPPWFLSGMEFVRFSLSLYKTPFDRDRVIKMAESLALDPAALKRRASTYSKGMRQKLGLMGTILTECPLVILDEPMSGLDPQARVLVKDALRAMHSSGKTVFLSSHILSDMEEICDRVAVLHEGTLRFIGTPAEMKRATGCDHLERAFLQLIEKRRAA